VVLPRIITKISTAYKRSQYRRTLSTSTSPFTCKIINGLFTNKTLPLHNYSGQTTIQLDDRLARLTRAMRGNSLMSGPSVVRLSDMIRYRVKTAKLIS